MKNLIYLFLTLVCLASLKAGDLPFCEDFGEEQLDPRLWQIDLPISDSEVRLTNGVVELINGARLVSYPVLPPQYDLFGRFGIFGNSNDVFEIVIGTTGATDAKGNLIDGTKISIRCDTLDPLTGPDYFGRVTVIAPDSTELWRTNYPIAAKAWYGFRILDNGTTISVALEHLFRANITVPSYSKQGSRIALQNQPMEAGDNLAAIDFVRLAYYPTLYGRYSDGLGFTFRIVPSVKAIWKSTDLTRWLPMTEWDPVSLIATDSEATNAIGQFYIGTKK